MRRTIASSLGKMPATSVRRLISPLRRSMGLVTGMRCLGANVPPRCSTSWRMVRPSGQTHREHGAGKPTHTMSRELELVAGRLCDSPGCAERANPSCRPQLPSCVWQEVRMRRVIGIDVHRTSGEAVFWENGRLRHAGRIDMTRTALEGFGKTLLASDEVVLERPATAWQSRECSRHSWRG